MGSHLFVPGSRPERFAKACASGADSVIIDWEDTVPPEGKAAARRQAEAFDFARHRARASQQLWLRLNSGDALAEDLAFLASRPDWRVDALVLPKAEDPAVPAEVFRQTGRPLVVLVETGAGLAAVRALAAVPGVRALGFGLLDLGRALGTVLGSAGAQRVFDHVRCELVLAGALHGLARPLETVYPDYADAQGFMAQARRAYEMGFGGQLCIHPAQVALAAAAYRPDSGQYELAQAIVRHFERTGSFAFSVEGMMVDKPLIEWAHSLLRQAPPAPGS